MKTKIFIVGLFCILLVNCAQKFESIQAEEIIKTSLSQEKNVSVNDGTDWMTLPKSYKIGCISGFMSGLKVANSELWPYGLILESEFSEKKFEEDMKKITIFNITVGQLEDGIDAFYEDFSNRRIKIIDAIYVVKMQIEEKNPELIKTQIRYLKMQPINSEAYKNSWEKWSDFFDKNNRFPTYQEIKNSDFSFEDLIICGYFIDMNNESHNLFCYGDYK